MENERTESSYENSSFLNSNSIKYKVYSAVAIVAIVIMMASFGILTQSIRSVEAELMNDRFESDIRYLCDELGENEWNIKNGALYLGDVLIGDGTPEKANREVLLHCEEITGTFYGIFMRTYNDDELGYLQSENYYQGHYIYVSGTNEGNDGKALEGAYIDREIADELESSPDGVYTGQESVNGQMIYCQYRLITNAKGEVVGNIVAGRSVEELDKYITNQQISGFTITAVVLIVLMITLGFIISSMLNAIKQIKSRLVLIGTGIYPEEPLQLKTKDEINDIAVSINEMVESLREKELMNAELEVASRIQVSMLPKGRCKTDYYEINAMMHPVRNVGGDLYDYFDIDEENTAIVIADVSGKGIPAAMFMSSTTMLIRQYAKSGFSPSEILFHANNALIEQGAQKLFVTAFIGIYNKKSKLFTYSNAGHNLPYIIGTDVVVIDDARGTILGMFDDEQYYQDTIQLKNGDRLLLYTDGVTEASDGNGEYFGVERLEKILNGFDARENGKLIDTINSSVEDFVSGVAQSDDITMITLLVKDKVSMVLDAKMSELVKIQNTIMNSSVSEKTKMELYLSAEELFNNICQYGFSDEKDKKGAVKFSLEISERITMIFESGGVKFNPIGNKPDVDNYDVFTQVGGFGTMLAFASADDAKYEYINEKNIITIIKEN